MRYHLLNHEYGSEMLPKRWVYDGDAEGGPKPAPAGKEAAEAAETPSGEPAKPSESDVSNFKTAIKEFQELSTPSKGDEKASGNAEAKKAAEQAVLKLMYKYGKDVIAKTLGDLQVHYQTLIDEIEGRGVDEGNMGFVEIMQSPEEKGEISKKMKYSMNFFTEAYIKEIKATQAYKDLSVEERPAVDKYFSGKISEIKGLLDAAIAKVSNIPTDSPDFGEQVIAHYGVFYTRVNEIVDQMAKDQSLIISQTPLHGEFLNEDHVNELEFADYKLDQTLALDGIQKSLSGILKKGNELPDSISVPSFENADSKDAINSLIRQYLDSIGTYITANSNKINQEKLPAFNAKITEIAATVAEAASESAKTGESKEKKSFMDSILDWLIKILADSFPNVDFEGLRDLGKKDKKKEAVAKKPTEEKEAAEKKEAAETAPEAKISSAEKFKTGISSLSALPADEYNTAVDSFIKSLNTEFAEKDGIKLTVTVLKASKDNSAAKDLLKPKFEAAKLTQEHADFIKSVASGYDGPDSFKTALAAADTVGLTLIPDILEIKDGDKKTEILRLFVPTGDKMPSTSEALATLIHKKSKSTPEVSEPPEDEPPANEEPPKDDDSNQNPLPPNEDEAVDDTGEEASDEPKSKLY